MKGKTIVTPCHVLPPSGGAPFFPPAHSRRGEGGFRRACRDDVGAAIGGGLAYLTGSGERLPEERSAGRQSRAILVVNTGVCGKGLFPQSETFSLVLNLNLTSSLVGDILIQDMTYCS